MLPSIDLKEYLDASGRSPFGRWFGRLDGTAAARVTTSLTRLGHGNWSNTKGVGAGIFELKVDYGPGYRVYFGKDGERIVILLGGGTKKRQDRDIGSAQECWKDYKRRKM
jgi:putative addiction module killer protein